MTNRTTVFRFLTCLVVTAAASCAGPADAGDPIRLLPDNSRYFEYAGEPVVLLTSGEHYGAVLNADFDFETYLKTLQADGMNYCRVFAGTYVEPQGAFNITRNTLAPAPGRFVSSVQAEDSPDGLKFDVTRDSQAFIDRTHAFLDAAEEAGLIVELTFFSSIYGEAQWKIHPFNPLNAAASVADPLKTPLESFEVLHTTDAPRPLLDAQLALVRHLVAELNRHDNLFYEIQNEPWSDNHTLGPKRIPEWKDRDSFPNVVQIAAERSVAWQRLVADAVTETEAELPKRHLIAQNVSNFALPVRDSDLVPQASILNFHYATPEAVTLNDDLGRVIGFDESGFAGRDPDIYRKQAWRFVMSGGGLFNHLDYTFTVGHERGDDRENEAFGPASPELRPQFATLGRFVRSMNLATLRPDRDVVTRSPGVRTFAMSDGEAFAVYAEGRFPAELTIAVPPGDWTVERWDVLDGSKQTETTRVEESGDPLTVSLATKGDAAAVIVRPTP